MSEATSRAGWQPATYYPDPAIHALDPRFEKYWLKLSAVERLATGLRWAEGPVWFGDGRYLLCSDIPNNRIIKWEEETGAVSHYRKPSNFANGHTRDRQGRLVGCQHGGRLIYRVRGSGFLKHMVRNIVGTLIEAGRGNLAGVTSLPARCGATAPARGLFLIRVEYPDDSQ